MGMSDLYGAADRAESVATIGSALAAGITLLDTGDFHGMGPSKLLLADALQRRPREVYQLSVTFSVRRAPDGQVVGLDARPSASGRTTTANGSRTRSAPQKRRATLARIHRDRIGQRRRRDGE